MQESFAPAMYSIAAVERETGLSKDTLRMWERRYGFPLPWRDAKGERAYSAEQVTRLRHLRRLVQTGHRPGGVVPLDEQALMRLLSTAPSGASQTTVSDIRGEPSGRAQTSTANKRAARALSAQVPAQAHGAVAAAHLAVCLRCIAEHDSSGLREQLTRAVVGMGLEVCVLHLVAPLTQQVGTEWAEGRFAVYEEHFYTECVAGILRTAIAGVPRAAPPDGASAACPRVLLTTTPREQHGLGLLMLEAVLALRGCVCLPMGTEMPIADIARAAQVFFSDIVALSFSSALAVHQVQSDLADLRRQLPPEIELWAGGQGAPTARGTVAGVTVLRGLEDVEQALGKRASRLFQR